MKRTFILLYALFVTLSLFAQRPTNNPFSRYGVGELYYQGFGQNRATGHAGIAYYSYFYFSKLNPASYTAAGRHHVIFSFAFNEKVNQFQTQDTSTYSNIGDFSHIAVLFPINKRIYVSLGIIPYSGVGYNINVYDTISDNLQTTRYSINYDGSGGINQGYLGIGLKVLPNLSLGSNIYYRWGGFDRYTTLTVGEPNFLSKSYFKYNFIHNGFAADFGAIWNDTIIDKEDRQVLNYSIGAIYSPNSTLRGIEKRLVSQYMKLYTIEFYDTLRNDTLQHYSLQLASSFGFGVALTYKKSLTFVADYYQQNWQGIKVLDMDNELKNSQLFALGLEYCADPFSSKYLKTIRFRLGGYIHKTYLKLNDVPIQTNGITFGIGLPAKSALVNLSVELGTKGTLNNNLFKENFVLFNIDLTMHDFWFIKRKYQ